MNLDHDFVQVNILSKDQKKRSSPKIEHFFFPISSEHLRSDAHQSQIIGGDTDVDVHALSIAYRNLGKKVFCFTSWANKPDSL